MSVMVDTRARKKRMAVKGLINASASRLARDFFFPWVTLLLPYSARLADTWSGSRPQRVVCSCFRTSLMGFAAAYSMRRFCSSRMAAFSAAWRAERVVCFLFIGLTSLWFIEASRHTGRTRSPRVPCTVCSASSRTSVGAHVIHLSFVEISMEKPPGADAVAICPDSRPGRAERGCGLSFPPYQYKKIARKITWLKPCDFLAIWSGFAVTACR